MSLSQRRDAVRRAQDAVLRAGRQVGTQEPFAAMLLRAQRRLGRPHGADSLLAYWESRSLGTPVGPDRYRWELTHARTSTIPAYCGDPAHWRAWHPSEQPYLEKDRFAFEERLTAAIVSCESAELLAEDRGDDRAQRLLEEAMPVLRRDFATYVQMRHAWTDTFALWVLARYEHSFERLHPLAVAVAECYAATARHSGGVVLGTRFPFHEKPLASASAHLVSGLLALGSNMDLVTKLVQVVRDSLGVDGSCAEASEPADVLSTFVAAELMSRVDPGFDAGPAVAWIIEQPDTVEGWWRVLGPEAPWLTFEIAGWLDEVDAPFSSRFRWPRIGAANLDRKTGLPFYAYFLDIAALFAALGGLARAVVPLAFIDLAGFREFNNRFGQATGDEVLRLFASLLATLEGARSVRDGGDEFLVIGAPTRASFSGMLEELTLKWPQAFCEHFGSDIPPVAPRVLWAECPGATLVAAREHLGRAVAPMKSRTPSPNAAGVIERVNLPPNP